MSKTMNVGQLAALLQQCPREFAVVTEGCDCLGEAFSLTVNYPAREVTINRRWTSDRGTSDVGPFATIDHVGVGSVS